MKIVFLTGSGISKESGIPTFREAGDGLWENYNVDEVATAKAIKENPELVYNFINTLRNKYKDCKPNSAHVDIANLEKEHEVIVITQNIDNLHEQAGSTNVIHLHGDLSKVRAVTDEELLFDYEEDITPESTIHGVKVRPHIVLFGENVPNIETARKVVCDADILVIVGTSLSVYPAALLFVYADCPIYYIDPDPAPTEMCDYIKVIKAKATDGMKELIKLLKND